jgi:hypothetical protein
VRPILESLSWPDSALPRVVAGELRFSAEFVALIGRSGCGQSELLRMIASAVESRPLRASEAGVEATACVRPHAFGFGDHGWISSLQDTVEDVCAPLILDNSTAGLDHRATREAIHKVWGTRQCFIATQDLFTIDCLPAHEEDAPDRMESARRTFVVCARDETGQISWRNMTADEASDFLKSWDAGVLHVSEILRFAGLL